MGYRMEISKLKHLGSGGKLYGYYDDNFDKLLELPSFKWLADNKFISKKNNDIYDYGYENSFTIYRDELAEFLGLYIKDYCEYNGVPQEEGPAMFSDIIEEVKSSGYDDCFLLEWC